MFKINIRLYWCPSFPQPTALALVILFNVSSLQSHTTGTTLPGVQTTVAATTLSPGGTQGTTLLAAAGTITATGAGITATTTAAATAITGMYKYCTTLSVAQMKIYRIRVVMFTGIATLGELDTDITTLSS